ncbi:hypothetical protein PIB30_021820 [Stylosanthes scabra]|uniref:Uncharacterized protein n=1 Tax=Stylosanthes scabra TaxID=79078 RepID=A0ABU6X812_9FABA|nr:hypothetical protein [Stylosanthes scabra]
MPESCGDRRGVGRGGRASRGRGDGGESAPTQQTQGGASTIQMVVAAGTSTQADFPSTPQTQGIEIPLSLGSPLQALLDGLFSRGFQQILSNILLPPDGGYRPNFDATQFDGSQFISTLTSLYPVHRMRSWLLVGLLHQQHTCRVDPGRYRSWSLPVCRLLQHNPHRLSSPMSQQHVGGPAELQVAETAAPEAICSNGILVDQNKESVQACHGLREFVETSNPFWAATDYQQLEEAAREAAKEMYRLDRIVHHVSHNVTTEDPRCVISVRRQQQMHLDDCYL